jgi:hypothetical protein
LHWLLGHPQAVGWRPFLSLIKFLEKCKIQNLKIMSLLSCDLSPARDGHVSLV